MSLPLCTRPRHSRSPAVSSHSRLAVGRVLAPHGIRGEIRVALMTDFPERFHRTCELYVGEEEHPRTLEGVRLHKEQALLKFAGLDSRTAAEELRGQVLYVPSKDAVQLPEGTYFVEQVLGLEVRTRDGALLGRVAEVLRTGSNDVYIVRGPEGELLLPAIHEVILDVDLTVGVMTVELLEGLR